jgi:hypothetical protein
LSKYAYTNGSKTKAFAAWISPDDFLRLTSTWEDYQRIERETGPLDVDELRSENSRSSMSDW